MSSTPAVGAQQETDTLGVGLDTLIECALHVLGTLGFGRAALLE